MNIVNNVDNYVKFKGTMTKWHVQKSTLNTNNNTKHVEH